MKWENKALMQFQGFSFRRRSERSFCEQPHLKQSNWHSDAPRRFPKAAHMKGPYNEGLDMCQTGMRDIFMVTEPAPRLWFPLVAQSSIAFVLSIGKKKGKQNHRRDLRYLALTAPFITVLFVSLQQNECRRKKGTPSLHHTG